MLTFCVQQVHLGLALAWWQNDYGHYELTGFRLPPETPLHTWSSAGKAEMMVLYHLTSKQEVIIISTYPIRVLLCFSLVRGRALNVAQAIINSNDDCCYALTQQNSDFLSSWL